MYKTFRIICVCGQSLECLADMSIFDPNDTVKCNCGLEWESKIKCYNPHKQRGGDNDE